MADGRITLTDVTVGGLIMGILIAWVGIACLYVRFEMGWHWIFTYIGVWIIFAGGIIRGMSRRKGRLDKDVDRFIDKCMEHGKDIIPKTPDSH